MYTYQDLLEVGEGEQARAEFVGKIIQQHKTSKAYKEAWDAREYDKGLNVTAVTHQKMLTTLTGRLIPDSFSANHKSTSNYVNIFTTQLVQFLLGNGASWENTATPEKLGPDFDLRLQEIARSAVLQGVGFGFFNLDHVETFSLLDFAPIYDEENGALMAGVHFWQVDDDKPLRATLYEVDGYTNYLWDKKRTPQSESWQRVDDGVYMQRRIPYKLRLDRTEAGDLEIYNGGNYEGFPIVPMFGNRYHESILVPLREKIDAYDLILNGFENDLDNAQMYWIIKGAGGMEDPDLAQFLDRLRTVKAAAPADGQEVQPVTIDVPHEARERLLDRLEKQLYKDAMIMNPEDIAGGAATATQIRAAYERQNSRADMLEYCVLDFLYVLLKLAGIEDKPTFTRSYIVNTQEEIQSVLLAAEYLSPDYVTRKVLSLLGDGDRADDIIKEMENGNFERLNSDGD